jgi:hypothetical protein
MSLFVFQILWDKLQCLWKELVWLCESPPSALFSITYTIKTLQHVMLCSVIFQWHSRNWKRYSSRIWKVPLHHIPRQLCCQVVSDTSMSHADVLGLVVATALSPPYHFISSPWVTRWWSTLYHTSNYSSFHGLNYCKSSPHTPCY